jgi:hypothetical protein
LATVINPCILFSWIECEWDDDYKEFAKKTVLDVVSELNVIYLHIDNLQLKMRECGKYEGPEICIPSQAPASPVKAVPKFVSLPSKYRLEEHPIYPRATKANTTDEGEFLKYINAALSPKDTDLVSFWQVCTAFLFVLLNPNMLSSKGQQK